MSDLIEQRIAVIIVYIFAAVIVEALLGILDMLLDDWKRENDKAD